ncbi:hypothetical protein [Legionella sp. PC997]|uniref:hypothetical protein n=1 Tax=Legionella sp. PC997 TaxID=2755562 RepID=UPI0015FD0529|nr:hypothetical protein [Legionella sp. PC997]QMT61610.1 hypothetical protein HBNCFIEN_03014 [Legionella sp. PC997]
MPKLSIIRNYYEPLKFIKSHAQERPIDEQNLIEYLNQTYRHALRKILLAYPASFAEDSPIFDLCIDVILNSDDLTQVTVKWIEAQINKNKALNKLKNLQSDDSDIKKLQLIKTVTKAHQDNLVIDKSILSFINSALIFEDLLSKDYTYRIFAFSEQNASEKAAINALKEALQENPVDLLAHLSTLRSGKLGDAIRLFVKQGLADNLLEGQIVRTVSEFITALHQQVNSNSSLIAGMC